MKEREQFRFLWHSVAPHIRSGYGNVTRNLLTRFKQFGYNFTVSAYYGVEPGGVLLINDIPVLPSKFGTFGETSCKYYYKALKIKCAWLHTDPWAFQWFSRDLPCSASYGPLDHVDYPEEIQEMMRNYDYLVSPSKFQQKEWAKYGIEFEYIPHGVDVTTYYPIPKEQARKAMGLPEDIFIFGKVAANSDKESRKSFVEEFRALQMFFDNNPDVKREYVKYFLFSNPSDGRGLQLELFIKKFGLQDVVITQDPLLFQTGIKDSEMCLLYNCFDVLCSASRREGFGLPIIEAQACGVPVIGAMFSSMPELIYGHGWLADVKTFIDTPINAVTAVIDPESIYKCMERAYFKDKERKKYARLSRQFAIQFNWDDLVRDKWVPLLDKIIEEQSNLPGRQIAGISEEKDKLWEAKIREALR